MREHCLYACEPRCPCIPSPLRLGRPVDHHSRAVRPLTCPSDTHCCSLPHALLPALGTWRAVIPRDTSLLCCTQMKTERRRPVLPGLGEGITRPDISHETVSRTFFLAGSHGVVHGRLRRQLFWRWIGQSHD